MKIVKEIDRVLYEAIPEVYERFLMKHGLSRGVPKTGEPWEIETAEDAIAMGIVNRDVQEILCMLDLAADISEVFEKRAVQIVVKLSCLFSENLFEGGSMSNEEIHRILHPETCGYRSSGF